MCTRDVLYVMSLLAAVAACTGCREAARRAASTIETKETTMAEQSQVPGDKQPVGNLIREDNRVWIDGVPNLSWARNGATTFAGALESALSVTERPYTYVQIMGYSGLAFRFRWGPRDKGWCPSVPVGEFPEEKQAVAWATGWRLRDEDNMANEDDPHMERFAQDVVASINAGRPVVGYGPDLNVGVAFGHQNGGKAFLWWDYFRGDTATIVPAEKTGPWLWFLEGLAEPPSKKEQLLASLKIAVKNWRRSEAPKDKADYYYLWGRRALKAWEGDIRDAKSFSEDEQKALFFANWWCMSTLCDARRSAVIYLNEYAEHAGRGGAEQSLRRAAEWFDQEEKLLRKSFQTGDAFLGPWSGKEFAAWTAEVRQREVEIIRQVQRLDESAIAEIEKALAEIKAKVGAE